MKASKATINAVNTVPKEKTIATGRRIVEFRADTAVAAIKKVIAQ